MKKSEFKSFLREEIISVLSEAGVEDLETQKAYNDELAKTAELQQQLGESDEDEYDIDVKEPTAKDLKKDSIATTASKLQKLVAKMKDKAKEFSTAEGKAKDKIKDELKVMTALKKQLEGNL
jgi:1,2-phenylacetyl-CoA epoxidase catalytic subunit